MHLLEALLEGSYSDLLHRAVSIGEDIKPLSSIFSDVVELDDARHHDELRTLVAW
jgi:hypothetical protein